MRQQGYSRVQAIRDWVAQRMVYLAGGCYLFDPCAWYADILLTLTA